MFRRFLPAIVFALFFPLPARAQFSTVINVPPDTAPESIDSDTQLNLSDLGSLPSNFDAGVWDDSSTNVEVNILGGHAGGGLEAFDGSTVNISGGGVGSFRAYSGSTVNISGGWVGRVFVETGATVNISGGGVGEGTQANSGSTVNISGGLIDSDFVANSGSTVHITGGTVIENFHANSGSDVNLYGGEFRLDGVPIAGLDTPGDTLAFNLLDGSLLSGTWADGTVFAFTSQVSDRFDDGTLTLRAVSLPAI